MSKEILQLISISIVVLIGVTAFYFLMHIMNQRHSDIVLLGDSHTRRIELVGNGMSWSKVLDENSLIAIGYDGYMSEHILKGEGQPLEKAISYSPEKVVLCVGANDAGRQIPISKAVKNIEAIVKRLRDEDIKVILVTVPPITEEYDRAWGEGKMQKYIIDLNVEIRKLSSRYDCRLLDLHNLLYDPELKSLPDSLSTDGLHLNMEAYRIWVEALKKVL